MSSKPPIMIVEDAEDIRELVTRLYQRAGYFVLSAGDGHEALQILKGRSELPAVILLDLMMPIMDGIEFRKEQERDTRLASIPVVLMTADANAREKSINIGAKGYIRKPVELKTLLEVAKKFCDKPE